MTNVFDIIYNCGLITEENIKTLKVSEDIIDKMVKEKYIELNSKVIKEQEVFYYVATELGEKFFKVEYPNKKYFYRGLNIEKNIALADFYCSLPFIQRCSWMNKDELLTKYSTGKPVDGSYKEQEVLMGVSLLSCKNTKEDVERVEAFVKEAKLDNVRYVVY